MLRTDQSYQVLQAVRLVSNEAGGEHDAFARVRGRMNLSQALGRAKHPIPGLRHDTGPGNQAGLPTLWSQRFECAGPIWHLDHRHRCVWCPFDRTGPQQPGHERRIRLP